MTRARAFRLPLLLVAATPLSRPSADTAAMEVRP